MLVIRFNSIISFYFLRPSFVKVFLSAFSVGITESITVIVSNVINIEPTIPMAFSPELIINKFVSRDTAAIINPDFCHKFPQCLFANFHVSSFFVERAVLYPIKLLIFNEVLHINLPPIIIIIGIKMLQKNINNQNFILNTGLSGSKQFIKNHLIFFAAEIFVIGNFFVYSYYTFFCRFFQYV